VHCLTGPQERLGRNARPVGALAADQLALDQRDAQPALGELAGAVLAWRAAAEHDDVVVAHDLGAGAVSARLIVLLLSIRGGWSGQLRFYASWRLLTTLPRAPRTSTRRALRRAGQGVRNSPTTSGMAASAIRCRRLRGRSRQRI
jgi:hypothetical protein